MPFDFHDKLTYLNAVIQAHCKKTHVSLIYYIHSQVKGGKDKKKMAEYEKLSASNNAFERNVKSISVKYGLQLERRTGGVAVVTPDELVDFTKAYEIQKAELKAESELLRSMGASSDTLERIEKEIVEWAQFHNEFYTHIQQYKET